MKSAKAGGAAGKAKGNGKPKEVRLPTAAPENRRSRTITQGPARAPNRASKTSCGVPKFFTTRTAPVLIK